MTDEPLWQDETGPPPVPGGLEEGQSVPPPVTAPGRRPVVSWPPLDYQRRHCRRPGCRCSHDNGCEFGWVDTGDSTVVPCPSCRPEQIQTHIEDRDHWLARLRRRR
jgi:hypothetical protein